MGGSGGSRHRLIFDALPGLTINTYKSGSDYGSRRNDWLQLCQNCFFACLPKNSDPLFAVNKAKDSRNASNAVPQTKVRAIIELNAGYLQTIRFAGDFLEDSIQHHGRKGPPRSKFDQDRLIGI